MSTNFPSSLDTFTNPSASSEVGVEVGGRTHSEFHSDNNDAIEALEAKVGADSSAVTTSHDYKLSGVATGDKAVSLTGTETLTNKTLTAPKFADGGFIADPSGNEMVIFDSVSSAVNEITIGNAATGNNPSLVLSGESNVGLDITPKGTGTLNIKGNATQAGTLRLYEDTDDGSNYSSLKVGTQSGNVDYTLPTAAPSSNGDMLTATTAGVMSWTTPVSAAFTYTFTAEEALTAGQTVGVSGTLSGKVARAYRDSSTASLSFTNGANGDNKNYAPIGGDKFVFLSYSTATNDSLYATVASIDRTALTVSLGTSNIAATSFTPASSELPTAAVIKLDTDKFIVLYLLDADTAVVKYRVGTVTGTTISYGAEDTFFTAASAVSQILGDQLATDKGIVVIKSGTATNGRMVAFTTSGTVATPGTDQAMGANTDNDTTTRVKKIATDKYVVVTQAGANSQYAQVCTVSGTTITAGTEAEINTATSVASDPGSYDLVSPATDVYVLRYAKISDTISLIACTVSGTTSTPGTAIDISSAGDGGIYAASSTSILMYGIGTNAVHQITRSGTTLTNGTAAYGFDGVNALIMVPMDNGYFVAATQSATQLLTAIQGMAGGFIGVAQATVARGASVNVIYRGKDSNQSGLTPGAYYIPSGSGGLTAVDFLGTVNTGDDVDWMKALSATEIVI